MLTRDRQRLRNQQAELIARLANEPVERPRCSGDRCGMKAISVAVVRQYGCPLVTLDAEIRQRAAAIITVQPPAEALVTLPLP